ncbi:MAG: hypothetical protein AB1894_19805 [Chloroflexota bacterium]
MSKDRKFEASFRVGVLILVLLAGCAPQATPTAALPVVVVPATQVPVQPSATATEAIAPEPTMRTLYEAPTVEPLHKNEPTPILVEGLPDLLAAQFEMPARLIPAEIDPSTQFEQAVVEYRQAVQDDAMRLKWIGGMTAGVPGFTIWLSTLSQDAGERIALAYPIQVNIRFTDDPALNRVKDVNLLMPVGGGGGGVVNAFPTLTLRPGQVAISPTDVSSVDLQVGGQSDIGYDFAITCAEPGVYDLLFEIPYLVIGKEGSTQRRLIYQVLCACPETATQWVFDSGTGAWLASSRWVLRSGQFLHP